MLLVSSGFDFEGNVLRLWLILHSARFPGYINLTLSFTTCICLTFVTEALSGVALLPAILFGCRPWYFAVLSIG